MNISIKAAALGLLLSSATTAYFVEQAEQNSIQHNIGYNVLIDSEQFNGHYYKVYDYNLTWNEANNFCLNLGGHLVTITSEAENEFVKQLISQGHHQESYWTGGYRGENSNWTWITDEEFNYSKWAPGEPNNLSQKENFIELYNMYNSNNALLGSWNDVTEVSGMFNRGFICEWDYAD